LNFKFFGAFPHRFKQTLFAANLFQIKRVSL